MARNVHSARRCRSVTPKYGAVTAGGSHNLSKSQYLLNSFSFSMDLPSQPLTSPIRNTITSAAPHCYCFVSCREGPRQPSLRRPLRPLGRLELEQLFQSDAQRLAVTQLRKLEPAWRDFFSVWYIHVGRLIIIWPLREVIVSLKR